MREALSLSSAAFERACELAAVESSLTPYLVQVYNLIGRLFAMSNNCAGCPNQHKGSLFLQCCRCEDKYHHTCVNFSKEHFLSLTKEYKDAWVCPTCRSKEPRFGDNSNTPIRAAAAAAIASPQCENVTQRLKPRGKVTCDSLSADTIREIIREELDKKFDTQIRDIQVNLASLDGILTHFNTEFEKVKSQCESQTAIITQLQRDKEELRATCTDLSQRLAQAEQLSRTCNVEIQCVPENKNENVYSTVHQLANTIKCPLSDSDINYCTRIAKLNAKSPRPRSILVEFSSRRLRDNFLAGVIKFNRNHPTEKLNTSHLGYGGEKKSAVFVSEHLTLDIKRLHAEARRKAKELNYRFCWVRDGKVFLRKADNSNYILVKDSLVLNKLS